ncbi:hypothetical protein [Kitasatospora herbaricolor]|uniref:Uncharacterized protein n=1 Tax=Kitasatospora herbaricolor TaxID=68217 RepID=A0ABZ1WBD0_9ACTN|nr:hypothetical protein [Kitasatospora herbaricolor]
MDDVTRTNGADSTDRQDRDGDGGGPPGGIGRSAADLGGSGTARRPAWADGAVARAGAVSRD